MAARSFTLLILPVLVAGCSAAGSFPSLSPRPIETTVLTTDPAPPPVDSGAIDPALATALHEAEAEAQAADRSFAAALPTARTMAEHAGAAGSESWSVAQQALSALEATRAAGTAMLPGLDAQATTLESATTPGRAAGLAAIAATESRITALDQAHAAAIAEIAALLLS